MDFIYTFRPIDQNSLEVSLGEHPVVGDSPVVRIYAKHIFYKYKEEMPLKFVDMINIAAAVQIGDRFSYASPRDTVRNIHLEIPVYEFEQIHSPDIVALLQETLAWFTGDYWSIQFSPRPKPTYEASFGVPIFPVEVGLWSGGLDSLAGTLNRILADPTNFLALVGTGSSPLVLGIQKKVATKLKRLFPNQVQLFQVLIGLRNTKRIKPKNKFSRARGFVFTLVGAAIADFLGQNRLYIYENGIGAINLRHTDSEVGADRSKAVHPISNEYMSEFISILQGKRFQVVNPFLSHTKAQMCQVFKEVAPDLIPLTLTCDRAHRSKDAQQCGRCTSCLMRRHALAASDIQDETRYVYGIDTYWTHLQAMLYQFATLRNIFTGENTWRALCAVYPELAEIVERLSYQNANKADELSNLIFGLYRTYYEEWEKVLPLWQLNWEM